jgi:hypothetical protein
LSRPNWSRRLPKPIVIPEVTALATLADVRTLIDERPANYRAKLTWQYVSKLLAGAAQGETDAVDVEVALRLVLAMEGVECRPRQLTSCSRSTVYPVGLRRRVRSGTKVFPRLRKLPK